MKSKKNCTIERPKHTHPRTQWEPLNVYHVGVLGNTAGTGERARGTRRAKLSQSSERKGKRKRKETARREERVQEAPPAASEATRGRRRKRAKRARRKDEKKERSRTAMGCGCPEDKRTAGDAPQYSTKRRSWRYTLVGELPSMARLEGARRVEVVGRAAGGPSSTASCWKDGVCVGVRAAVCSHTGKQRGAGKDYFESADCTDEGVWILQSWEMRPPGKT